MKKLLILAAALTSLGLGACNKQACPAYGNSRAAIHQSAPVAPTASVAAPAARL